MRKLLEIKKKGLERVKGIEPSRLSVDLQPVTRKVLTKAITIQRCSVKSRIVTWDWTAARVLLFRLLNEMLGDLIVECATNIGTVILIA